MATPLESLVASGTKLWLDSVDPDLVEKNLAFGATGATSNPSIISDLVETGRYDTLVGELIHEGFDDEDIAWGLTDHLVETAQQEFFPVWEKTGGDDGYVSFELDPLIEDPQGDMPHDERVAKYVELGEEWAAGQPNRMIKVPGTEAGIAALERLAAAGVTLNVTLLFTLDQYERARDAVWRGAQRRDDLENFKSVYSIFVSRIDVYTEKHCPDLDSTAQGLVGILNAKRVWQSNQKFWADKGLALNQEIIFASTGTKKPEDKPWKYVEALAGSDIQTNPPATNDAAQASGLTFPRRVDEMPSPAVQTAIDAGVDFNHLHDTLMREGVQKFADPQKALLEAIASKRAELATA
ncbi:transaldolase family protein [Botrimarina mediterranea]|uniref:Transaldolase n=1 Tax=Botrimarina mediterranea TaxID=2528022 RepID=A0A518K247_9BACT|nr:transaldolase family protein [Botrimarina mediterranea]QDV71852.1 Transaldolase [Botrimarina mediterranea]QDV76443.1 Transaldolase [Planctomycetes bacterium K2D]